VLTQFLPDELELIDNYLRETTPGRENRSALLREAALEWVRNRRKKSAKAPD
jgi:hypothetical protein